MTLGPIDLGSRGDGKIQSVVRAADILRLLTRDRVSSISVAEASTALGLQRPTTHRYFATLVSVQLLQRDSETGRFILGPLAHELFATILRQRSILTIAPPRMQALADRAAMSAALSVWDGRAALVSHMAYPRPADVTVRVSVGFEVAPAGAQTAMFLAFLNDQAQVEALLKGMEPAEATRLRKLIARARADKFLAVGGDLNGIRIIAAPIFDPHGICATMALLSTTRQLPAGPSSAPAKMLREVAAELTAELNGTAQTGKAQS